MVELDGFALVQALHAWAVALWRLHRSVFALERARAKAAKGKGGRHQNETAVAQQNRAVAGRELPASATVVGAPGALWKARLTDLEMVQKECAKIKR